MEGNKKDFIMSIADISALDKKFDFRNQGLKNIPDIQKHQFIFEVRIGFSVVKNEPYINLLNSISIFLDKEKTNLFGHFELGIRFLVENIEDYVKNERIFIPEPAIYTMVTTAIGTARGVLYVELKVSPIPNLFLPFIEIKPIVDNILSTSKDGLPLVDSLSSE